jgi:hypothetical protein
MIVVLSAAVLSASALSSGTQEGVRYFWASLASSIPVALVLVVLGNRWPQGVLLGLVGLFAFNVALAMTASVASGAPPPLAIALILVLALGTVLIASGRARLRDVLESIGLTVACAAFIYELSISVHNLF